MEALKYVALILALVLASAMVAAAAMASKPRPEPAPAVGDYAATWEWCGERFPYRNDLQEACRWGAYEMLPGAEDTEVQDA